MKNKSLNKEIITPILNDEYKVIVCWGDDKFLNKVFKSWGYDKTPKFKNETYRGITAYQEKLHPIIVLREKPNANEMIGTLAHEAVHAINYIFDTIEENGEVNEIFAHSVGAIVRKVLTIKQI